MKRILFIQPPFERLMGYTRFYTHQGLLSLAAVVKSMGNEAMVYDADYNPNGTEYSPIELLEHYNLYIEEVEHFSSEIWNEIKMVIANYNPTHLGITVLSPTLEICEKIADVAKKINKNICIIAGGAHATIAATEMLDWADYIIRYEGEMVINDILEGKIKDRVVDGPRIMNLDSLPFPDIESLYGLDKYEKRDLSLVMSTRGCPYSCKFCASPLLWKCKTTRKSVAYFVEEMMRMKCKYNINDFYISDDSFSVHEKWFSQFCEEVKKADITWRCLDRVTSITDKKVKMMQEAGCRNIKIGIESGSQRILNSINKKITIDDVYYADEIFQNNSIPWSAFFMIGIPGETEEDIRMTQRLIQKISASSITLSIFTPYPGNELMNSDNLDYKLYSHHSPNNNFTGTIPDDIFKGLVLETLHLCERNYKEHEGASNEK